MLRSISQLFRPIHASQATGSGSKVLRRSNRQRSLRFRGGIESLERREVMTGGMTASFTDGVLAVIGTEQPDTIVVRQVNNRISVDGVNGSYAAASVNAIAIDAKGGNDYVSLEANGQVLSVPAIIDAGAGNDHVRGGNRNDVINLGVGDDVAVTHGGDDIVYGGNGNDCIWTGDGNDRVSGDAGNDDIVLGSGNDFALGGMGQDRVWGEAGNDRLLAGTGNDMIVGGLGDDAIYGEDGGDVLYGTSGNDVLLGGYGDDTLFGGDGVDQLYGEAGVDYVYGEAGNDLLFGGSGNDRVYGGAGNDRLNGESGADYLFGEAGSDRFYDSFSEAWTSRNDWRFLSESWTIPTDELFAIVAAAVYNYRSSQPVVRTTNVVSIPTNVSTTTVPAGLSSGSMFSFDSLFAPGTIGGTTQAILAQQYQNALKTWKGPTGGDRSHYYDSLMGNLAANSKFSALVQNVSP